MGLHKGRGGVKAAGGVALPAVLLHPLHGVGDDCACGGIVVGEFARARERDACAVLLGDGGDFGVVGGDDDLRKAACALGSGDAVGNHGFAVERFDVFAGDAFAAAAGGDDAEGHGGSLGWDCCGWCFQAAQMGQGIVVNGYARQPEKRFAFCNKRGRGLNVLFFRLHQAFEAA